jgi:hypothetical protein
MNIIGIDMATGPDLSVATFRRPHFLEVGDRLDFSESPHRYRHYVRSKLSAVAVEVGLHVRPSRGYARHVRRLKASRRT